LAGINERELLNYSAHKIIIDLKFYIAGILTLLSMKISGQSLPQNGPVSFLALGDSYTIGESVAEDQRWPVLLCNALTEKGYNCKSPAIIATTGWRTDDLKRAIEEANQKKTFDLVSLLIGVNNQYQGRSIEVYAKEFEELLTIAIDHAGGDHAKVFVLSIPDYGYTPFGKNKQAVISTAIDEFNAVNKTVSEKYKVRYYNITDISRMGLDDPELIADDGLHPSGKMYNLWVKRLVGVIED
jgi:lysophospholipase L1-like esterase